MVIDKALEKISWENKIPVPGPTTFMLKKKSLL